MSDSVKYYFEENFGKEKTEEKHSQDVINIKELFRLLSVEDRILVKRIIAEEKIFQCEREKISVKYLLSKKISAIFAKEIKINNYAHNNRMSKM